MFNNNIESPTTGADLKWGTVGPKWHPEVKSLFKTLKDNEFSKFFYQTDIHMIRLLCIRTTEAFLDPDMTSAGWKIIWDQWDKFGVTMKSRANLRYTIAQTVAAEDYSLQMAELHQEAFKGDD
jgi:hypothetical protein